jgi:aspartyl protease family protein
MLRLLSLALVCIVVMAIAATALSSRGAATDPSQVATVVAADPLQSANSNSEDTELARDASGKFRLGAIVNGEDTQFLIDTGADTVALSIEDAERLGVEFDRDAFAPIAETASGTGNGAHIIIRSIEIAGQEFHEVEAIVIEGLRDNLLGQSLLRKLGKLEMQGDKMVIRRS